jgi:hypothetical protein
MEIAPAIGPDGMSKEQGTVEHPYTRQPTIAFWSRSVARDLDTRRIYSGPLPLLGTDDVIMSAGSCFAANIVPFLEGAGLRYLRTETAHPSFARLGENLGYASFSAAYGNIYTARQLLQLLLRATGAFAPAEDRWEDGPFITDPFRPGLRFKARSHREFDVLQAQHLRAVRDAFTQATVLVFTLGLTEAWESVCDGAVFPACPGTVAGAFDPDRHRFRNFRVLEIVEDLERLLACLREINPGIRLVLTVSPVPLVATATAQHVVSATVASKSILRAAAQHFTESHPGSASYFPAYEIITGPQAEGRFFEIDRRNVSKEGIATVMRAMLWACGRETSVEPVIRVPAQGNAAAEISKAIVDAECEEAMADGMPAGGSRSAGGDTPACDSMGVVVHSIRMLLPRSQRADAGILGQLSGPAPGDGAHDSVLFTGWCLGTKSRVTGLVLRCGNRESRHAVSLPSPGVARLHPAQPGSERCRFRFRFAPPPGLDAGLIRVFVETADQQQQPFAEVLLGRNPADAVQTGTSST